MSSQNSNLRCQNPRCLQDRGSWFTRWRRPKGIWFNKKWYCNPECFEQGAAAEFSRINLKGEQNRSIRHRLPLGLLMLSKGFISRQSMQKALNAQRESQAGRFGEWLLQLGIITEEQLATALGMQWGCPVFHLTQNPGFSQYALMVPFYAMETARMAPVHFLPANRMLYVAFSDGIDFSTLRSIEQMLDFSTQPCVITESEMAMAHRAIRQMDRPSETVLDCPRDFHDLARQVREWAEANQAERVGAVPCPECLWVRIESPAVVGHLLFRFHPDTQPSASHSTAKRPLPWYGDPVYT